MREKVLAAIEGGVFTHRRLVLLIFGLITLVMCYQVSQIKIDAGFQKLLPLKHPYMQTFMEYREEFGGANRLLIAARNKEGDIFTPEFFDVIKNVTDEVFFLPGVNRSTVQSIFTPNVRFTEIVEGGFAGGNVIPADFRPTPEGLALVRENILKAGIVGRLVANDFTAAMVTAQLVETDPRTGEKLDYLGVARQLEEKIRDEFQNETVDIHIIGFAKMIGDIADGAAGVVMFFGVAFLVTWALVYLFTRSQRLTLLALLCSVIAVIWDLGLLRLLGFGIDPMSILVPFLVFAIGVSHGVQMVNGVSSEIQQGANILDAARGAFRRLVIPGGVALITDTIGFLTILFIEIRMIQELALTASLGVLVIILTNLIILPILLSYMKPKEGYRERMVRAAEGRERIWTVMARVTQRKPALIIIVVAALLLAFGMYQSPKMQIGDMHAGVPELRAESRYNQDAAIIVDKFSIGVDIMTPIVETVPDGCIEYDVMSEIDRFQWRVRNVPGVQSTISMPQIVRRINAGWNEGNLKWHVLPRKSITMVQSVTPIETSTGLLNRDCSGMPVMIFMEDHKAGTINDVIYAIEEFAKVNDSDRHRFRLACGNVGVMAATNQVVEASQVPILLWVYAAVITLCLITFRSIRVTLCIILPLSIVSVLCYALMSLLGIGLKTNTLPVAALGVGVGVDYGIYIFSRVVTAMREGADLPEAYLQTLRTTGAAVLVTGLTLAIGVSTWVFSALKFQADMGLLLSFMFLANMLGALLLLPSLAFFILPSKKN
jgi:predicted RND superfamily exporter protein